jgi:hypothetical protein
VPNGTDRIWECCDKQKDYNYTLGTELTTSELGKYLNISHNYNKTLAIPYATENNGGAMSAEDKKALTQIIEGGGLDFIDLGDMSPAEIIKKLEDGTTGIFLVRDNTSGVADIRYTIYKTFVPNSKYSFFATKLEWKGGGGKVNTIGTFGGDKYGHGSFIPILVSGQNIKTINGESILGEGDIVIKGGGVTEEYVNDAIAEAITTTLNTEV